MTYNGKRNVSERENIAIRVLQNSDMTDLFKWRNNPEIRKRFFNFRLL